MDDVLIPITEKPIIIDRSIPSLNYISRNTPYGPEKEMVNRFLSSYLNKLHSTTLKTIVFLEPHIDTGYPDIVIVRYTNATKCLWNTNHLLLSNTHYKILFEINRRYTISLQKLSQQIGIEYNKLIKIVEALSACNLVLIKKKSVQRIPQRKYFCVKQIISFEAKISKWPEAITQALNNTRFATESYILMNRGESSEDMVQRCCDLGIGIYLMNGKIHKDLHAHRQQQPITYTSYLINELILRIEHMGGINK